jgi:hypothetical protein
MLLMSTKNNGKLRHPANGKQWQDFKENHQDFADQPRNVRFTLSPNGMNPFAERSRSTAHGW